LGILTYIVPFLIVLGVLIFIHEFGHFAVAKLFGVKVETFSLGFGPRLFGFKYGDTDYRLSGIPLGGYVKMKGENLDEKLDYTGDEFLAKPKWQRLLILFAGPWMNIVLAIAVPMVLAMYFYQEARYYSEPAIVGSVALGSAAEKAGIQAGDKILKIDSLENPTWRQVELKTTNNAEIELKLTLERAGQQIQTSLTPSTTLIERQKIGITGLGPQLKEEPVLVEKVNDKTPAKDAGLQDKDKIVKLNGETVKNFYWFRASVQNLEGKETALSVERAGQIVELKMVPRRQEDGNVIIGFTPGAITPPAMVSGQKSFSEAFNISLSKNYEVLVLTKEVLKQIFTGQRKAGDALAGPIQIAAISGKMYQTGGVESLLNLMALLSLNLGVFNLFPIPVLDGGHMFIIFLEALLGLGGLKLSLSIKEKMMQTGFVMLLLLMGFVILNDAVKVFTKPSAPKPAVSQPAQTTQPPPAPAQAPPAPPAPPQNAPDSK
jgi:regulator of sigma E protease